MPRQIGESLEAQRLWEILQQLKKMEKTFYNALTTTTTTTTP